MHSTTADSPIQERDLQTRPSCLVFPMSFDMWKVVKNAGSSAGRAWFDATVVRTKEYLAARPSLVVAIGVLAVISVGLIALVTGAEISLSIFYLVPVAFT